MSILIDYKFKGIQFDFSYILTQGKLTDQEVFFGNSSRFRGMNLGLTGLVVLVRAVGFAKVKSLAPLENNN
ncbi:MAG: hypothetical protein AB8W37_11730 [Arsenophonus endosymbiont of Dermacentor nuttalli]